MNTQKNEMLSYALENGIIDISQLEAQIEMKKREEIIKNHPYEIWQGKNGYWYTYLDRDRDEPYMKRRTSLDKLKQDIIDNFNEYSNYKTVSDVFYEWHGERHANGEIADNSYYRYTNDFKRFFKKEDAFCCKRFSDITEFDIEAFIKMNIKRYHLKRKGYEGLRTLLMGIFKYAKGRRYTTVSITTFFSDLHVPRTLFDNSKKNVKLQYFSEDEEQIIVEYLWDNPSVYNLGLLLMFLTGLRIGELVALQPKHICGDHILVENTEVYYKDEKTKKMVYEIKENVKLNSDDRNVIITKEAEIVLKKIKANAAFGEYLFMRNGKRIHGCRFNYHLGVACDAVGIPRRSTHSIRKTYATKLIDANVDESLICQQMGHADISTTRNYYYFARQSKENKKYQLEKALCFA